MRGYTRIATAVLTVGLAASMAACSSSGGSSSKSSSPSSGGSSTPTPVGAFKTLSGNTTSVKFDPSFVSAITGLGVTPAPVAPATLDATTGVATFPITGGNATIYKKGEVTPYVQGEIDHKGGLSLKAGDTTVTLQNFIVDPGNNSKLSGEVLVNGAPFGNSDTTPVKLFDLDGSTLQTPTLSGGVATLTGTTVYVSQAAAGALNTAFKLTGSKALPTTFEAIKVGVATIMATGS